MIPKGVRAERRFPLAVRLRIASLDRPWLVELGETANVSPGGARILVKDVWRTGERVIVESPGVLSSCQAEVTYCEILRTGTTALGLRLAARQPNWVAAVS
jgi:hypothetical protein